MVAKLDSVHGKVFGKLPMGESVADERNWVPGSVYGKVFRKIPEAETGVDERN
jgi:hypothetical protein